MAEYGQRWKTVYSQEDPPHRISFAKLKEILYWIAKKKFRGELVVQFPGKDNIVQVLYIASTPQYIPITNVDDIDEIIKSQTEGEEE